MITESLNVFPEASQPLCHIIMTPTANVIPLLVPFHIKCGLPQHNSEYITQRVQKSLFCFSVKVSKKICDKDQTKQLGVNCVRKEGVSEEGKKRTLVMLIKKDGVKRKGRKIK